METFNNVVLSIKDFLWGPIMLCLLIGTHVLLTIRTKGIQRKTFTGVKLSVTPDKEASGDIGGFAALATALAATIGTGNIVGVATAIGIGGPGAVFWMWFTGLLGMATKYGEATLAVKYRVKAKDGLSSVVPCTLWKEVWVINGWVFCSQSLQVSLASVSVT